MTYGGPGKLQLESWKSLQYNQGAFHLRWRRALVCINSAFIVNKRNCEMFSSLALEASASEILTIVIYLYNTKTYFLNRTALN